MRFIKYILILNIFSPHLVLSLRSTDLCSVSFSNHKEFINDFFSDPTNINQYERQQGFVRFVDEKLSSLNMDTVFSYTSEVLPKKDMNLLNWQVYFGTTKEFEEEISRILDEDGNIKERCQGPPGYLRYADDFYEGDMSKAYQNVSAVLGGSKKKSLNWQQYKGTTKEFKEEISRILDNGNIRKRYQGALGNVQYADDFYEGDMSKAYRNVSAVLGGSKKKNLNWREYQGTTREFKEEISRILDNGNIRKRYQGPPGYLRYADDFYEGDMSKAYQNVSAVLVESKKKNLNWQKYQGTTKEFKEEISRILDKDKNIKERYRGPLGNVRYADDFYEGDMLKAYQNVSAVLVESKKKILNWQQYHGTTKEFKEEISRILDNGNIRKRYQGPPGYLRFADDFYEGDMKKTYKNVSAVLVESKKKKLNWQQYHGTTKEFKEEISRILDEDGNIREEYEGPLGNARYADDFYEGDMLKAHINVSAVLVESKKKKLNWQQYQGTTEKFKEEISRILDKNGNIKERYQGPLGNARYADDFYEGDMKKAHINVSAVLDGSKKKKLNWQQYSGTTEEFKEEVSRILDEDGNIREEYEGSLGNARYADDFYEGNMKKAYMNVSAVLTKADMKDLSWKKFFGDTNQFRSLFEFFKNHNFEDYRGPEGQKKIARMIFKNHLSNTYTNISILRDYLFSNKDEFKNLRESGWSIALSW